MTDPKDWTDDGKRYRNWCFTLNNWTLEEKDTINTMTCKYMIFGEEVGDNGTPHLQGYFELATARTLKAIKKDIGNRVHLAPRWGTAKQASDYCKKEGKFTERGKISRQGERTDLNEIGEAIAAGTMTIGDILEDSPIIYHQYGRTLEKLQDHYNRKKTRTWMTKGKWFYGPTGTGKSYTAFRGFNTDTHYIWNPNDNGWWDGYEGQEIVIINEFRGQLPYGELLDLVDCTPYKTVKRRCREPTVFLAKTVIITSSLPPEDIYHNLSKADSLDQLKRRFEITYFGTPYKNLEDISTQKCSEGNTEPLSTFDDTHIWEIE